MCISSVFCCICGQKVNICGKIFKLRPKNQFGLTTLDIAIHFWSNQLQTNDLIKISFTLEKESERLVGLRINFDWSWVRISSQNLLGMNFWFFLFSLARLEFCVGINFMKNFALLTIVSKIQPRGVKLFQVKNTLATLIYLISWNYSWGLKPV